MTTERFAKGANVFARKKNGHNFAVPIYLFMVLWHAHIWFSPVSINVDAKKQRQRMPQKKAKQETALNAIVLQIISIVLVWVEEKEHTHQNGKKKSENRCQSQCQSKVRSHGLQNESNNWMLYCRLNACKIVKWICPHLRQMNYFVWHHPISHVDSFSFPFLPSTWVVCLSLFYAFISPLFLASVCCSTIAARKLSCVASERVKCKVKRIYLHSLCVGVGKERSILCIQNGGTADANDFSHFSNAFSKSNWKIEYLCYSAIAVQQGETFDICRPNRGRIDDSCFHV